MKYKTFTQTVRWSEINSQNKRQGACLPVTALSNDEDIGEIYEAHQGVQSLISSSSLFSLMYRAGIISHKP